MERGHGEHSYDHEQEQRAYENAELADDADAGPAGGPDEAQPDQAEGEGEGA